MLELIAKGQRFLLPETYLQGHRISEGEAEVLNRLVAKLLREAMVNGAVKSRSEAQAFALSDAALGKTSTEDDLEPNTDLDELL